MKHMKHNEEMMEHCTTEELIKIRTGLGDRMLLAVDPGKRLFGYSYWDGDTLVELGLHKETKNGTLPTQALTGELGLPAPSRALYEWPQVYGGGLTKEDPNDLLWLSATIGGLMSTFWNVPTTLVHPRTWKGNVPKKVHHERLKKNMPSKAVAQTELFLKAIPSGERHNVWDAVGLGFWGSRLDLSRLTGVR